MDCIITELCYKGTIFQRNYRTMTIHGLKSPAVLDGLDLAVRKVQVLNCDQNN